jgi:hypothetical protein
LANGTATLGERIYVPANRRKRARTLPYHGEVYKGGQERERMDRFEIDKFSKEVAAGIDVIGRFSDADWWSWNKGSSLFFWRWPEGEQRKSARDGMQVWIRSRLPRYTVRLRPPHPHKKQLILEKLQTILDRGYVVAPKTKDSIRSLMDFFPVEKDSDLCLVYNGTSCGLNEAVWAPNFWLPSPATAARTLGYGYYMADIDLGEIFLNFTLHETLQRFSGVDFS